MNTNITHSQIKELVANYISYDELKNRFVDREIFDSMVGYISGERYLLNEQ